MPSKSKNLSIIDIFLKFAAPLCSVILIMLATGFFSTFVSIYLNSKGVPKEGIGLVQSAFYAGLLMGAFKMEALIRRVGHIQALAVFASLGSATILVQFLSDNLIIWAAMRFLNGTSLAAVVIVLESWMLYESTLRTRGTILSIYMITYYIAQAASQQFLYFLDPHSVYPYLVASLFISFGVIPVCLSTQRIKLPALSESMSYSKILKGSPFGASASFVSGLVISALYTFIPIYAESVGLTSQDLMTALIVGGVSLQWPLGKLSDVFDRRKVLLGTLFATIAIALGNFYCPECFILLTIILTFAIGGVTFALYPVSVTQVCDVVDQASITKVMSMMLIIFGIGSVCGPAVSSIMITAWGINALYTFAVICCAASAFLGILSMMRKPMVPADEQNDFVQLPRVTPVAYEMDPRNPENESPKDSNK